MGLIRQFDQYIDAEGKRLDREEFIGSDILRICRSLLGKVIVSHQEEIPTSGVIVELEAYKAPEDKASHAYNDRKTERTEVMFMKGGHAYVYLCYGIHHMFNIVTGPQNTAHAILVRAIEPLEGMSAMMSRRGLSSPEYRLTSGPGSLARAMGIHTRQTGTDLITSNKLFVEDRGIELSDGDILTSERIGIDYAGEWAKKPWRFTLKGSPWVSR